MPSLKIKLDSRGGIITVGIGVSMPRAMALKKANLPIPAIVMVQALIDTGASCTCVDPDVIAKLGITPSGTVSMHSASTGSTPETCNQFDVAIVVAMDTQLHVPALIIPIIECPLIGQGFQALIGRDILDQAMMIYDGPNRSLTLTF